MFKVDAFFTLNKYMPVDYISSFLSLSCKIRFSQILHIRLHITSVKAFCKE